MDNDWRMEIVDRLEELICDIGRLGNGTRLTVAKKHSLIMRLSKLAWEIEPRAPTGVRIRDLR